MGRAAISCLYCVPQFFLSYVTAVSAPCVWHVCLPCVGERMPGMSFDSECLVQEWLMRRLALCQ